MALLQNKSIWNQYPLRQTGGLAFSNRVNFGPQSGNHKNRYLSDFGTGFPSKMASTPQGYNLGEAFFPPMKNGALANFTDCLGSGSLSNSVLAQGLPCAGTLAGNGYIESDLQLIVSLAGSLAGQGILSQSELAGILQLAGTAEGDVTFDANLGAIINIIGTALGSCSFNTNLTGDAYMSGEVSPYTELSPQSLANAVWTFDERSLTAASTSSLTTEEHNQLMSLLKKSQFIALK